MADSQKRRSVSTVCAPNLAFYQQYNNNNKQLLPPPQQQQQQQQNFIPNAHRQNDFQEYGTPNINNQHNNYYHDPHNMGTHIQQQQQQQHHHQQQQQHTHPIFDPERFSPPVLDNPPIQQHNNHAQPMLNGSSSCRPFPYQKPILPPNNWNKPTAIRKFSMQTDFCHSQYHPPSMTNNCMDYNHPHEPIWTHQNHTHHQQQQQQQQQQQPYIPEWKKVVIKEEIGVNMPRKHSLRDNFVQPTPYEQPQQSLEIEFKPLLSPTPMFDPNNIKEEPKNASPVTPMEVETTTSRKKVSIDPHLLIPHRKSSSKRHINISTRKASIMAQKSQLRSPRVAIDLTPGAFTPYTPPPILTPMRNGSGLFWQITKNLAQPTQVVPSSCEPLTSNEDMDMSDDSPSGLRIDDGAGPSGESLNTSDTVHPTRKNGFFYMANHQSNFQDELDALRKASWTSTSSTRSEDYIRKRSVDPDALLRKASCMSDCYYDAPMNVARAKMSDANPHINIGRDYQARVRKWMDRKITKEELDTIPDRDECIFSTAILRDVEESQVEAFEKLACSQAIPHPGRNKELALHLLMENKGNIESAVMDLLRSDTLDWEQYHVVHASGYLDTSSWSIQEIWAFQDALFKTEKDFHQVAQELTNKNVRECVEFYYIWKKACPDDYRKLRNLRRKRQLLDYHEVLKKAQEVEKGEDIKPILIDLEDSDCESDATAPSYSTHDDLRISMTPSSPLSIHTQSISSLLNRSSSPTIKDCSGLMKNCQPMMPRHQNSMSSSSKKGAQPSADGLFHCRLCDKSFEKVKSLNAHMKSHAMKARAEAEAKLQAGGSQIGQSTNQMSQASPQMNGGTSIGQSNNQIGQQGQSHVQHNSFGGQNSIGISGVHTMQGINGGINGNNVHQGLNIPQSVSQNLLSPQLGGLPHPRPQHPLLSPQIGH